MLWIVSTHSRPKAAGVLSILVFDFKEFQLTAARRRLAGVCCTAPVSWLFQLTAARRRLGVSFCCRISARGFNSQPPEGGWVRKSVSAVIFICFNSQPPEGGWRVSFCCRISARVSTHSRPKAAGQPACRLNRASAFQLTAARRRLGDAVQSILVCRAVSTHSRPKAAGKLKVNCLTFPSFQLTAARRRLE